MMVRLALAAFLGLLAQSRGPVLAGLDVPAAAPDLSGYARKTEVQSAMDAMSAAMTAPARKLDAVPTTGPGAGLCRLSVVPSELVASGGVTGTAGTCSRIVQCGTSAVYVVVQFNIGGGR